jgi:plastocyanin
VFAVLLLVVSVACAGGPAMQSGPVRIEGNDRLRFEPDDVKITGGKHRFTFANAGGLAHDFRISTAPGAFGTDTDVYASRSVPGGRSVSFEFELQKGTYEFVCRVDNHDRSGMRGKLVVT